MSAKKTRTRESAVTVVFDFGGVLSAGTDPVDALHEILGGDRTEISKAYWSARSAFDSGAVDAGDYYDHLAEAAGIDELTEDEVEDLAAADNAYWLRLAPESRALLHDLARSGTRIAVLSNAPATFAEAVRQADWFEAVCLGVFSGEEKISKPDPEIYRVLLDALAHETGGVSIPNRIVFFDDREANVAAARALGIDAHLWPANDSVAVGQRPGWQVARAVLADRGLILD
ncbi:HAD family hydrolase [Devriesea agamarum]|uniref:HAD family hydrolase n=1 Tax=Devriesea agamarum TaxID=472569 RepID=UPI00071CF56A|nr:HAD family phosphatase [Devriesea agamarum]